MRFQVPQFTEQESKLIGPLSLRQFLWFAGAGVVFIFAQFFAHGAALLIIGAALAGIAAAMAYVTIDGLTLPQYILTALVFLLNKKKFFYDKDARK